MSALPKHPFQNLAISMSGGGYRATAFHLGTLSYLSKIEWEGTSMLDRVRVISSVSGGTFTAAHYSASLKQGKSFEEAFKELYNFMCSRDLIGDALKCLADDKNWIDHKGNQMPRSLIKSFAIVYHRDLQSQYFKLLFQEEPKIHLKEIIFNATEFNFGLPFRHQKTELTVGRGGALEHGNIGNYQINIPQECAEEMRLADIIASSSCFPLGFEPINFPDDFIDENSVFLKQPELMPKTNPDGLEISYPIGLMDGGIDDNQGIDSVVDAERRMRNYPTENHPYRSDDVRAVDLFIVSDVSSPYMEGFVRTRKVRFKGFGKWSFRTLKTIGIASFILGLGAFAGAYFVPKHWMTVGLSVVGTVLVLTAIILRMLSKGFEGLTESAGVPDYFTKRLRPFDTLDFNTYGELIANRVNSASTMISEVFMKQIRRLQYGNIYNDDEWRPRLIMNAVYELNYMNCDLRNRKYKEPLPSEALQQAAESASTMGTTLWFTEEELEGKKNKPNSLVACGQFTVCYNLKDYIERIMRKNYKDSYEEYSPEMKANIEKLYEKVCEDWKKFQEDPYFMVDEFI